jgi:hypothetical protein
MRRAALLLAFPALIAAAPVRAQDAPAAREYAVWSALLDTRDVGHVVVNSTRDAGPFKAEPILWGGRPLPVPDDVLQSFREANTKPLPLENRFRTRVPVQLLSRTGPRVPGSGATVSLTRVGFSGDGRTALVYLSNYCGAMCGHEAYYLLALGGDGRWTVTREYVTREF